MAERFRFANLINDAGPSPASFLHAVNGNRARWALFPNNRWADSARRVASPREAR